MLNTLKRLKPGPAAALCAALIVSAATAATTPREAGRADATTLKAANLASVDTARDRASAESEDDRVPPAAAPDHRLTAARERPGARDADPEQPVYVPPRRGAPVTRVGGGTRQADGMGEAPRLALLGPEHTGMTRSASPTLYWFLSAAHDGPFELVVTERDAAVPLLELRLTERHPAGIHALRLADHDVVLRSGRTYQWSVSLVRDEQRRSRDVVAVSTIERVAGGAASADATVLAAEGLWYDAVEAVSPASSSGSRAALASLLHQVGLPEAAAWADGCRARPGEAATASC